jgi:hypothetical protein
MSKRLDNDQVAPAGTKVLGGVYGYVMQSSLPAVLVDLVCDSAWNKDPFSGDRHQIAALTHSWC